MLINKYFLILFKKKKEMEEKKKSGGDDSVGKTLLCKHEDLSSDPQCHIKGGYNMHL